MPTIKSISDLRDYDEVLRHVAHGAPVLLTSDGDDRYAVLDIAEYKEYQKMLAWHELMGELEKGRRSIEEGRCSTHDEVWERIEARIRSSH